MQIEKRMVRKVGPQPTTLGRAADLANKMELFAEGRLAPEDDKMLAAESEQIEREFFASDGFDDILARSNDPDFMKNLRDRARPVRVERDPEMNAIIAAFGPRVKVDDMLDKPVIILGFKTLPSKFSDGSGERVAALVELDGERRTLATGSGPLIKDLKRCERQMPVSCVVKKAPGKNYFQVYEGERSA